MQIIKVVAVDENGKDIPETLVSVMTLQDLKVAHELGNANMEVLKSVGARLDGLENYISLLEKQVKLLEIMVRLK